MIVSVSFVSISYNENNKSQSLAFIKGGFAIEGLNYGRIIF